MRQIILHFFNGETESQAKLLVKATKLLRAEQ